MNNKISASLFLACALMLTSTSCAQIKASKNYITKNVKVENFNKIELLGSPTIIYTQSTDGKTSVQIYGSDNLVDLLDINVKDNTLVVKFKKNTQISWTDGKLKVIASSPSLEAASLQGSGDIVLDNDISSSNFTLNLQGSGDINAKKVNCANNISVALLGSGDIDITGGIQAKNMNLKLQGSGDINVKDITASATMAELQGSGDINVGGNNNIAAINVSLQGSGDFDFIGIAASTVKATLQGSGDMKLIGTSQNVDLEVNNSGNLDAKDLKANNVTASLNGSGNISCYAKNILKAGSNGNGDIHYKGNPAKVELPNGRAKNIKKL